MWRLAVLTDRRQLPPGRGLVETLRACAAAGLPAVFVREHDLPAADRRDSSPRWRRWILGRR